MTGLYNLGDDALSPLSYNNSNAHDPSYRYVQKSTMWAQKITTFFQSVLMMMIISNTKSLYNIVQNLMGIQQFTEMTYYIQN